MNKQELIDELYVKLSSGRFKYSKSELVAVIDPFIDILAEALSNGDKVRITNLGKFVVKVKKERRFYNLFTETTDYTQNKKVIVFTPCKNIQIKINMHDE